MATHELPEEPVFAFAPEYDLPDQPQQIRIVFEGMSGYVPTALVALSLADAERLCDRLNRRLGLTRDRWTGLAARSMRAEAREPGDPAEHCTPAALSGYGETPIVRSRRCQC